MCLLSCQKVRGKDFCRKIRNDRYEGKFGDEVGVLESDRTEFEFYFSPTLALWILKQSRWTSFSLNFLLCKTEKNTLPDWAIVRVKWVILFHGSCIQKAVNKFNVTTHFVTIW